MTRARTFLAWVAICFAFALVLVSTACPEDDVICVLRSADGPISAAELSPQPVEPRALGARMDD